jgi:hypothetical protein
MGTGHRSRGSGDPPLTPDERKPSLRDRSDAHLFVREAAEDVARELHDDAPEGEFSEDGAAIQRTLHGWGTPLQDGAVGGPPSRERGTDSDGAASGGAVGSVGGAASSGAAGGEQWPVGAVALAGREGSELLDEQIRDLPGLGAGRLDALHEAGYRAPSDVLQSTTENLMAVDSIGEGVAQRVQETVAEEYDRPVNAIDYGLGLGNRTDPDSLPAWSQQYVQELSTETQDVIGKPNFEISVNQDSEDPIEWVDTTELERIDDPQAQQDLGIIERSYQIYASKMAASARDEAVGRAVFENVSNGMCITPAMNRPNRPSHKQLDDGTELRFPAGSIELDFTHEFGHAATYRYGYDIATDARDTMMEYNQQSSRENPDPYVYVDPDDSDYLLSHDHGHEVADEPAAFAELIDRTNEAWQRVHRATDRGEEPEQYVALINYSSPSATEYFAVMNSYLQTDWDTVDEAPAFFSQDFDRKMATFLLNQPEVSKAYFEVFHPGEAVRDILTTMRDDPDLETPYDDYQLPSEREQSQ